MLGFGRDKDASDLIARRKYKDAIPLLEEQVRADGDTRSRLQLADVLVLAGRPHDAVPLYMRLADDYAAEGLAPRAIAMLKKVQRLDPSREDVEHRLAAVISHPRPRPTTGGATGAAGAWAPREGADKAGYEPSGAVFGAEHFEPKPAFDPDERIAAARAASWVPETRQDGEPEVPYYSANLATSAPEPSRAVPEPAPDAAEAIEVVPEVEDEALRDRADAVRSPLFSSLEEDELVAVIRGLRLSSWEPGDIVITQGDPGDSLFVVTSGELKTFIRDPGAARQLMVRTLAEGDFFGEISILSGRPRTATITVAVSCELLELDKATLDAICGTHPRVREVLEEFYVQRASTQEEAMQRAQQVREG